MGKEYIIVAYDGSEVIDNGPEAIIRLSAMDALEDQYYREQRRKRMKRHKLARNPLWKLAVFWGLV